MKDTLDNISLLTCITLYKRYGGEKSTEYNLLILMLMFTMML